MFFAKVDGMEPVLIKKTQDGRKVEVIGLEVCLDGAPETTWLQHVFDHPNREKIKQSMPNATHMAGRIPLSSEEARLVIDAFSANEAAMLADPTIVTKRMMAVVAKKARNDGIE